MSKPTKSPRTMLALVALTDLPMPTTIRLQQGRLSLEFATITEASAWVRHLGGEPSAHDNPDGWRYLRHSAITWYGWTVQSNAYEPTSPVAEELDPETVSALEVIAEDGGEQS